MKYADNSATDISIAYIGGGSRGWAWGLMCDLALEEQMSGNIKLYDLDFEAAHNNEKIGNSLYDRKETRGKWKYKAVKTIDEALKDADFVIISIQPGPLKAMESDVHTPEKYGIYQAVGDTVGPGGTIRALRALPTYVYFAEKIKEHCPKAWVINYTNPMTLCTRTLYKTFPDIKAFGCCHEIFSSQMLLTDVLGEMAGIKDVKRSDIKVNVLGINHFTWIDKASYKGLDLMPMYEEFVDRHYSDGYYDLRQRIRELEEAAIFGCHNMVKFDLFKRYGLMAAAGDRHLAEFMPPWYIDSPATVAKWKFSLTPMSYRFAKDKKRIDQAKRLASGQETVEIKRTEEESVDQIKALLGLEDIVTNVNLPNKGQLPGFPDDAVVETNAYFSNNRLQPVYAGEMPDDVKNLVMRHVLNHETIIKAVFTHDLDRAFRAFINDPLITINADKAKTLFDEMIANTKEHFHGWYD
jgi:galacturan 1,4-alpha-galacturonidase